LEFVEPRGKIRQLRRRQIGKRVAELCRGSCWQSNVMMLSRRAGTLILELCLGEHVAQPDECDNGDCEINAFASGHQDLPRGAPAPQSKRIRSLLPDLIPPACEAPLS
jgi:hypothetical protein